MDHRPSPRIPSLARREGIAIPKNTTPRIDAVEAIDRPLTLRIRWLRGGEDLIDLSGILGTFRFYAPLRDDAELFRSVGVGEHGTDVVWRGVTR